MSITDAEKLDVLWKLFKGVTPTSSDKQAHNEAVVSRLPIFQQDFWTDSDRIPGLAPDVVIPVGNELWFEIVVPHLQENALQLVKDPTTKGLAWHAMDEYEAGIQEGNRLRDWIPPQFHRSYHVTVWAGNPTVSENSPVRLSPVSAGFEWEFNYASGTLYFPNGVPPVALEKGIWIEGWRYTGEHGREGLDSGNVNTSKIREYSYVVVLGPNQTANFDLPTGGKCILVEAKVTHESTLECHGTSLRTDTNPYKFRAITSHLVDDGSYVSAGQRYYGERFVPLINMEDTTSDLTYWRITNNETGTRSITVIVKVA